MSTSHNITALQQKILDFITESIRQRGIPPTVREIGRHCRITSPSSVAYHLRVLETKGLLQRKGAISRGLALTEDPDKLPILGRVGAGGGQIAEEDVEGHMKVDPEFMRSSDFLLRVRGDSMEPDGIMEDDYVQVLKQDGAKLGDLVVAIVGEEEGVVKRLGKRDGSYVLESSNTKYPPITEHFQVVGKVVGLVRRYGR
jgi:repressor LexA